MASFGLPPMALTPSKTCMFICFLKVFYVGPSEPQVRISCSILGHLGVILGSLGAILGRSWALLVPSWALLGRPWGHLGLYWDSLAPPWTLLGASWCHPGATLGCLGAFLALSWATLRPSWANLRPSWALSGAQLGPKMAILAVTQLEACLDKRILHLQMSHGAGRRRQGRSL